MTIYFLKDGDKNIVKIGYTKNLVSRLKAHRIDNKNITILAQVDGDRELEDLLHNVFRIYGIGYEWYNLTGNLKEFVEKLIAGTDIQILILPYKDIDYKTMKSIEIPDYLMERFRRAIIRENNGTYTRGDQKKKAEELIVDYCKKIEEHQEMKK